MLQRFTRIINEKRGFTLIELMIVVAIIGILASIAIPNFQIFRKRAFDAGAVTEAGNARLAMEAYFADRNTYNTNLANLTAQISNLASTANVTFGTVSGGTDSYTLIIYSNEGTKTYTANTNGIVSN